MSRFFDEKGTSAWVRSGLLLVFAGALSFFALGSQEVAAQAANCQPPNLMMILDNSCSMEPGSGGGGVNSGRSCTNNASCNPMERVHQPAPGYSPRYAFNCTGSTCRHSRWDLAVNSMKEVVFQYGGTAAQNYADRSVRFGLTIFNSNATVTNGIVSNPPQISTTLSNTAAGGGTSYVNAFNTARSHLQTVVNNDALKRRPTHIMFITDGEPSEGCASSLAIVRDLFNGTGTNRLVDNQNNVYNVKSYVIGFGSGISANGQSCLNQLAQAGGTQRCNPSVAGCVAYYAADNSAQLQNAINAIVNNATQEVCDNIDNDCNGLIDDGLVRNCTGPCGAGTETCVAGAWQTCTTARQPTPEICNNIDDDCNGQIDDGLTRSCQTACGQGIETCQAGQWRNCNAPQPQPEQCNNRDDDCDGQIDNNLKRPCSTACGGGEETCTAGQWGGCTAQQPAPEICDNLDNDCNGQIDDGLTRSCSTDCGNGTETCQAGQWVNCNAPLPQPEQCNGRDDDCNGMIDDGLTRPCQNQCGSGTETCTNGTWGNCNARQPAPEQCNGKDDDCDGVIDNITPSPQCEKCIEGICFKTCTNECPRGFICREGICRENPCLRIRCGNDQTCQNGACVDACTGVACPNGQICIRGQCQDPGTRDCYQLGCPAGQACINGQCVPDACTGVTCQTSQFCRQGQCIDSCANVTCDSGFRCKDGQCVEDGCGGQVCPDGQLCTQDQCVTPNQHPCAGVQCDAGRYCEEGQCVGDPCVNIVCPEGHTCQQGQCYGGTTPPPKIPDWPNTPRTDGPLPDGVTPEEGGVPPEPDDTTDELKPEGDIKELTGTPENGDGGNNRPPVAPCACTQQASFVDTFPSILAIFLLLFFATRRRS